MPLPPNVTCDIYRGNNSPPAAPDVAGVAGHLLADYAGGLEHGEGEPAPWRYTHLLLVERTVDVRDNYAASDAGPAVADLVYIPDRTGTPFRVAFVERRLRGTPQDHKRVYLQRLSPNWPTNQL